MKKLFGLLFVFLTACSVSSWNPANDPKKVPSSFGPCGSWVDCSLHEVITDQKNRCCPLTMACAVDDGGPYCAADENFDPSDPVTWGRKVRYERAAHGN